MKGFHNKMLHDLRLSGLDDRDAKRARLKYLAEDATELFTRGNRDEGDCARSYQIPYIDGEGNDTGFARLKFLDAVWRKDRKTGELKPIKYFQKAGTPPALYMPPDKNIARLYDDVRLPFGLTEGEKKALKATKDFEPTLALGGIWSYKSKRLKIDLLDELKALAADGREIFITFDGDGHTNIQVRKAENDLAGRLTEFGGRVWIRELPPGRKLDDLLVEEGAGYLRKLPMRAFDKKRHVSFIREMPKVSAHKKREEISKVALTDMAIGGKFFKTPDGPLYFDSRGAKPMDLSSPEGVDLRCYVNDEYGINAAESEYRFLYVNILTEAEKRGGLADFRFFAQRSAITGFLYIAASETTMFRIDDQGHQLVANGTDGVILRAPASMENVVLSDKPPSRRAFEYILGLPNIVDGKEATADEMRMLLEFWLWGAICGRDVASTWPIAIFHGPKGSAKTVEGKALVMTLYGPKERVLSLDKNRLDGLDAALTNKHLVVLDNVDGSVPGIENRLATAATGGSLAIRKLYKSNELMEIPIRAFMIVTSREPDSFTRDDVVDRLLYIKVATREDFIAETEIMARVLRRRGSWWTYALSVLPKIVVALKNRSQLTLDFRMADFATFALTIAPILGYTEKRVLRALRHGEMEKIAFVADQSTLPDALAALVASMQHTLAHNSYDMNLASTFFDVPHSATALLGYLKKIPGFTDMTVQGLGQAIIQDWKAIQLRVPSMYAKQDKHLKTWKYVFRQVEDGK